MTRLQELYERAGQSPWLDNLKRSYLTSGRLVELVSSGIRGLTSNPTIMAKAIAYGRGLRRRVLGRPVFGPERRGRLLGSSHLRRRRERSGPSDPYTTKVAAGDGFVSIEVSPSLAHDTAGTIESARDLHKRIAEPNLLREDPRHPRGPTGHRDHDRRGPQHQRDADLLPRALPRGRRALPVGTREAALAQGGDLSKVGLGSVVLREPRRHRGRPASRADRQGEPRLAGARRAPWSFAARRRRPGQARLPGLPRGLFSGPRWERLEQAGARRQRPLWASTSTKNPAYGDLVYVESLVAPTPSTRCRKRPSSSTWTTERPSRSARPTSPEAKAAFERLAECGIDVAEVAETLETEGVAAFAASFDDLLDKLHEKADLDQGPKK